jgi:hypothetical protein
MSAVLYAVLQPISKDFLCRRPAWFCLIYTTVTEQITNVQLQRVYRRQWLSLLTGHKALLQVQFVVMH